MGYHYVTLKDNKKSTRLAQVPKRWALARYHHVIREILWQKSEQKIS